MHKSSRSRKTLAFMSAFFIAAIAAFFVATAVEAQMKQAQMKMKEPPMVTLSGTVIDLTCASKAKAMMDSWKNTEQDHMMPDGKVNPGCAAMCLKSGQPGGLFANGKIAAVFACSGGPTLSQYAAKKVELQGFWAGDGKDVKTFVPTKIREGAGAWQEVVCAEMHQ